MIDADHVADLDGVLPSRRLPLVVAFASGKGGVGKTTLVANIGWLLANWGIRTLLVDLDLQNRGASSLFASARAAAESLQSALLGLDLEDSGGLKVESAREIAPRLYFLPAPAESMARANELLALDQDMIQSRLCRAIAHIGTSFDCILLDCHGGVDALALAAAAVADTTVVVAEADPVAFGGTISLLDAYRSSREPSVLERLRFIVNRVSPGFEYRDIHGIFTRLLTREGIQFDDGKPKILGYLPAEPRVVETLGIYPFFVEIDPKALISQKLALVLFDILSPSRPELLPPRVRQRFAEPSSRDRLQRRIVTADAMHARVISNSYAVAAVAVLFLVPLSSVAFAKSAANTLLEHFSAVTAGIVALAAFFYFWSGAFRLFKYYLRRLTFQRALVKATGEGSLSSSYMSLRDAVLVIGMGMAIIGPALILVAAEVDPRTSLEAPLTQSGNQPLRDALLFRATTGRDSILSAGYSLRQTIDGRSFSMEGDTISISLDPSAEPTEYTIVAACDDDCSGLQLSSGDSAEGYVASEPGAINDAVLAFVAKEGVSPSITARIQRCRITPCFFSANVYSRRISRNSEAVLP